MKHRFYGIKGEISMTAQRVQYNGMLLLASYVQRLHVFYATLQHVENKEYQQLQEQKEAFDSINAIMPMFEVTKTLTMTQFDKMQELTASTIEAMQHYFQPLNTSFGYKVAIVTSTFFAEQMMNNGIIRLSHIFKEEISQDFDRRVKFYEERTKMMQIVVLLLKDGKMPEDDIVKTVEKFYDGIMKNQKLIIDDLQKISPMIKGEMQ